MARKQGWLAAAAMVMALSGCVLPPLEEEGPPPVSSSYLCDEGRTFNAFFEPQGRKVSFMFEGGTRVLYRQGSSTDPVVFAGRGISLQIRGEPAPSIWVERNGIAIYRNCHQATATDKGRWLF